MTRYALGDQSPRVGASGALAFDSAAVPGVELLDELGRGAHTVVYRARRGNAMYAVKVLATPGDEREATEFRREAALLACVEHPGLVRVHEVGEAAGHPYLIMDLVDGRSLADVLRTERLDEARVVDFAVATAAALVEPHRAGLVHRDIKPSNLMIGADDRLRVIDFGLAARSGSRAGDVAVGTFTYSAPEQTGVLHRAVDGRADLYALGVVLFECLAGAPPFVAVDAGDLIRLHLSAAPAALETVCPDTSPAFAAVVAKLLAKDPDDRYQTADGLRDDLERIREGESAAFPLGSRDSSGRASDVGLVGRAAERTSLLTRWDRATGGTGGAVLVAGPPGSGKSRLVRELTTAASDGGHLVLYGKCEPDNVAPLGVLQRMVERHIREVLRQPEPTRTHALEQLRAAAGETASVLTALSPALGALLDAPELAAGDHGRRLVEAVAALLVGIARTTGGAVLHIDDVQWCDDASRGVLRRLAELLPDSPALLVVTARDDVDSEAAVESFATDLGPALDLRLTVQPLTEDAIAALVGSQLGSSVVPAGLLTRLASRSGGSPMAVLEYVRAVVDAGLLRPSWGTWQLDQAGLEALALPEDILELVLRRIDGLGADTRELLTVAAAVGIRFSPDLVGAVGGVEPGRVHAAFTEAAGHRLVEAAELGGYLFLHDRIREAVLAHLDEDSRRELHHRIGMELEHAGVAGADQVNDGVHVYEVARHYLLGGIEHHPERVFRAAAAAGALALHQHAPVDAVEFLTRAQSAATAAGLTPDATFHADLGLAAIRVGDYNLAVEQVRRSLDGEHDPVRRARLFKLLAEAHLLRYEGDEAIGMCRRGIAELGRPLPTNPLMLLLSTFVLFVWGVVLGRLPVRLRAVSGAEAERHRLRCELLDMLGEAAATTQRMLLMGACVLRALPGAQRLRPDPAYTLVLGSFAMMAQMTGRRRHAGRTMNRAIGMAAGDLRLTARLHYVQVIARDIVPPMSATSGAYLERILAAQGRWLDFGLYLTTVAALEHIYLVRGYAQEAEEVHRQALSRAPDESEVLGHWFGATSAQIAALLGRPAEAARQLQAVRDFLATTPGNAVMHIQVPITATYLAVEQGELGEMFERAVAEFDALGLTPAKAWPANRSFWVYLAFGRLAQAAAEPADQRAEHLAAATIAVATLGRAAKGSVMRAYHEVARSSLAQLGGGHPEALRRLGVVEGRADGLDLPLLSYEIARVRARAYRGLARDADAQWQARIALILATDHGWLIRARWIRAEFGIDTPSGTASGTRSGTVAGSEHRPTLGANVAGLGPAGGLNQRRLHSLQQVGLAAATMLDPVHVARVALDEIVTTFAAERAFLFLREIRYDTGIDIDSLVPYLGRDETHTDLADLTGYGSTLVDRVRDTGEPLVITGSEEGAALGSRSTVIHGLRSIMVAPLMLKGRLLGVIYLDSRAAKGIFTADDVHMLAAITNHVAASLETARAAQLELGMHAARRERDLAQLLHQAMTDLGASLDPEEVSQRLIDTMARALPIDSAVLLRRADGGIVTVAAVTGGAAAGDGTIAVGTIVDLAGDPASAALLSEGSTRLGTRVNGPSPLPRLFGTALAAWLVIPLTVRGEERGLLVAGTTADRPYTEAEAEIATALAGQGAIALENALLFRQVEELAIRDGLTGLFNRRYFFELAGHRLITSRRYQRPLAAIMIDIDHFKRVNDTHGHSVGDEVIREVAGRLAAVVRDSDILCRYGGEEFAVLLPETSPEDAHGAARRLHLAVSEAPIPTQIGPLRVSVSVGLAGPRGDDDVQGLLKHADEALYAAKHAGRDRVAVRQL